MKIEINQENKFSQLYSTTYPQIYVHVYYNCIKYSFYKTQPYNKNVIRNVKLNNYVNILKRNTSFFINDITNIFILCVFSFYIGTETFFLRTSTRSVCLKQKSNCIIQLFSSSSKVVSILFRKHRIIVSVIRICPLMS